MADSYISGSEPDKKLQTYLNTISGQSVHSEAVTPTDPLGVPFSESNPFPVSIASDTLVKGTFTAATSGDSVVYTPASGKAIRLYFFGYSAGGNVSGCLTGLKLAGYNGGAVFDNQHLSTEGQPYARNIQGGKRYIQGSVNGALAVNLSVSQTVYVNYELEEI